MEKYGRLTILEMLPSRRARCLCDCGNEKVIKFDHLRTGAIKSCGCLNQEMKRRRYKNRLGEKIESPTSTLEVIEDLNKSEKGKHVWLVKCLKCGHTFEATYERLLRKSSCLECLHKSQKVVLNEIRDPKANWSSKPTARNSSGVRGVSFHKRKNKWYAYIAVKGASIYLGSFETLEEAKTARRRAEKKYWGLD